MKTNVEIFGSLRAHLLPTQPLAIGNTSPPSPASQKLLVRVWCYVLVQALMPLRHYLYPGNVRWTEEGHNFAWHMKLRTKVVDAVFTLSHPASGQTCTINPEDYLKRDQVMTMITKPELILAVGSASGQKKRGEGFDGT